MRVLIDTHIWIWLADRPKRLGRRTARLLASDATDVFLSAVSVMEVIVLSEKGRLGKRFDHEAWLPQALTNWPLIEIGATWEIVREAGKLRPDWPDPADRWLMATARVLGCPLVTDDAQIIESGLVATIPND